MKHVEKYRSSMGSPTLVYRMVPEYMTAKEEIASYKDLYYPGRKKTDDLLTKS